MGSAASSHAWLFACALSCACTAEAPSDHVAMHTTGGAGGASGMNAQPAVMDAAVITSDASASMDAAVDAALDAATDAARDSTVEAAIDAAPIDTGATDPATDGDRCDVAIYDPTAPPSALDLSGSLGTHDPSLIEEDGVFYLFQTGDRIPGKRSTDLRVWQDGERAFASKPSWIASEVPQAMDLWAPDVSHWGGQYHLYYSASWFGSNDSCIGHATRARLDSGSWSDQGPVVCSNHDGASDDWNAIDPNVVLGEDGKVFLVFGSFWDGIRAIELDAEGARSGDAIHALASRHGGAIEAPFVVRRCGFYYLFVSFDRCCDGASSTYNVRVGRSENALGPYVDRDGVALLDGGGTQVVNGAGSFRGPGHNAVIFVGDEAFNVFHAYRADNGAPVLRVAQLAWDEAGWPISGGP